MPAPILPWTTGQTIDKDSLNATAGMLYVYNNSGVPLPVGTYTTFDPTYTSGLGVKIASTLFDQRVLGPVMGATIGVGAYGFVYAPGFAQAQALVTGAIAFGHSLYTYSASGYLQDSGGGGWGPGIAGWALGAQASGTNLMNILLHPYPAVYVGAQVVTQKYGTNDIPATTLQTWCANVVNVTPNQLLLFFALNGTSITGPSWNSQTPALVASDAANQSYIGTLLGAGAATANFQGTFNNTSQTGVAVALALNGVNQSVPLGAWAHQGGSTSVNLTVACTVGDFVLCVVTVKGAASTFTSRNQQSLFTGTGSNTAWDVQYAIAQSTSVTFTETVSGSPANISVDGVAVHTA